MLVVDDEPETLAGYSEFLAPAGAAASAAKKSSRRSEGGDVPAVSGAPTEAYTLHLAATGEQAVEIFKKEFEAGRRIAAGFFDVKLGAGMDGLSTINAIRKIDPEIHVVVVTAYHDRTVEEIHQLFGESFKDQWDYLNKPFTQGEIVQKARQMVSSWNKKREVKELTEQLIRSERLVAIGQVARGIGHEFGNILLRVIGKADLALLEKDVEKIHEHLKVLLKAAERAGVIVRNLQTFAKPEQRMGHESVIKPIEESLSLVQHELVKASVKVEKDYKCDRPTKLDSGGIAQVVLNLAINAIHAMPKGGTLSISVVEEMGGSQDSKPGIATRIKDTGSGIPADVLPRIFEYAFTTKGDRGSGLGLSVSKQIVEAHEGTLTVQTELGKGTEFRLWLPLSEGGAS